MDEENDNNNVQENNNNSLEEPLLNNNQEEVLEQNFVEEPVLSYTLGGDVETSRYTISNGDLSSVPLSDKTTSTHSVEEEKVFTFFNCVTLFIPYLIHKFKN